jgi:hypothetical protein
MITIVSLSLALGALGATAARAAGPQARAEVDVSTSAPEMPLDGNPASKKWLAANFPLKTALTREQESGLETPQADAVVAGLFFGDATPGALLMKLSPSKKTLARLTVLRWTKDGWKPVLRCGKKGPLDAKGAAITESDPVDVYDVYMRRRGGTLGFLLTLGKAGDKLFGDPIVLAFDRKASNYVWPDAWSEAGPEK